MIPTLDNATVMKCASRQIMHTVDMLAWLVIPPTELTNEEFQDFAKLVETIRQTANLLDKTRCLITSRREQNDNAIPQIHPFTPGH